MGYEALLVEHEAPVATITMNRPERRNALSVDMMQELIDAFKALGGDQEVRAVVLAANGPAFSAGHDLRELVGGTITTNRHVFDVCTELMTTIQSIPQPVIAEVQKIATAAGCQLVATCDLAVAATEARFATPGVRIGLFCTTPMVALSRAIGRKRALQMLLTGEPITAATAAEWGLINQVVTADELASATRSLALSIAAGQLPDGSAGKAGILQPDRSGSAQGLCLRQGSDEYERYGIGCAGGHVRLPGEA